MPTLNERIQAADAKRRARNIESRQEYLERVYSQGWRPDPSARRNMLDAAWVLIALGVVLAFFMLWP